MRGFFLYIIFPSALTCYLCPRSQKKCNMEEWELEFEWLRVRHLVKDHMKQTALPDLNMLLLLIGIQELGYFQKGFSKEEKQDLMHLGVCRLLSYEGYYEFEGRDADGWPHYKNLIPFTTVGEKNQEILLKTFAIRYFKDWEAEITELTN